MAYGDIEDLARRIAAGIQYYKTAFNIAKTPNMMDVNVDLLRQFTSFFLIK